MKAERLISTGPRRGVEQTCTEIVQFVTGILDARKYPETANVRSAFEQLLPLLRFLITVRGFGEPAITVSMPDLQVDIRLSYDPAVEGDLTPPNVALLDPLVVSDSITVTLRSLAELAESMRGAPAAASTRNVRFELGDGTSDVEKPDLVSDQEPPPGYPAAADEGDAGADGPAGSDEGGSAGGGLPSAQDGAATQNDPNGDQGYPAPHRD